MIKYFKNKNILDSKNESLINTVNCVGVMGKGIALQFKEKYPLMFKEYKKKCDKKEISIGKVYVYETKEILNPKYIINFPTKEHWREESKLEYIKSGLKNLKDIIKQYNIQSITLPPLGCGNGGLNWNDVKKIIENELQDLDIIINVCEPNDNYIEQDIRINITTELTEKRVLLLMAYDYYIKEKSLYDVDYMDNLELQKIPYFLQEFGGCDLKLTYHQDKFGPYTEQLWHFLNSVNNTYITGYNIKSKQPEESKVKIINLDKITIYAKKHNIDYEKILKKTKKLLYNVSGNWELELLSSVHYLIKSEKCKTLEDIIEKMGKWGNKKEYGERKKQIFTDIDIENAYNKLVNNEK